MATDFFKMFDFQNYAQNFQTPNFNFDSLYNAQRRNLQAVNEANQVMAESFQAVGRRQAEAVRGSVEDFLSASKELVNGASPQTTATKQTEFAKTAFENSLSHMREVAELFTKSSYEAFDVLNKRFAENLEEMTAANGNAQARTQGNFNQQAKRAGQK